ncbi:type I secretion system permease/ATPase [Rhizobium sp. NLR10a]|uniref:type I secretion system permease/ATPase n=1 Tax=unclassified Rhizobium TaxID=2613769 RepID=UPI001C82FEDB|nr:MULTISPECIES: type I secretion system permease/ATPase [unclassified Rhizobium]MBX5214018.1 type I secretion system permease/ATPase [Rhizobium sp. NLR9a]MBX5219240.1 type I secretion system permease/ATPase [Rhizobium sp. NLR8a]MBX5274995.1 type I secretion system permease/ATPase [Rhizobium sp. NLR13a]MBX5281194.1 type I secretion system permease/ATPase [Rhizobium sp. NLR10a]MBX5294773.1 type I secretion system permease/ATPase [Rhizobium sp. NLR15a]
MKKTNMYSLSRAGWGLFVFSVAINVFLLVPSIYMMQIYDRVLPSNSTPTLVYLSILGALSLLFLAALDIVRTIFCQRLAIALDRNLASKTFSASLASSRASAGDSQPLRDLSTARTFIASRGLSNLIDLPFAPLFMVLLAFVHPLLCLVTVIGAAILLLLVLVNQVVSRSASSKAQEASIAASLQAQAFARSADTIHGMGMMRNVTAEWGTNFAEAVVTQDRASISTAVFSGTSRVFRMALQLGILAAGAFLVMRHEMTAGMIFASSTLSGRALQPIDQLVAGWKQVIDARKAWTRLKKTLHEASSDIAVKTKLPAPLGRVSATKVSWSPPGMPESPVVKELSFDVREGQMIAIIGPSGSGKSTVARLIAGIITPQSGEIRADGCDYRNWDNEQLGSLIGYIAQDVQLLPGTIAQNISRFDRSATDDEITAAALKSEAHSTILTQAQGYQTSLFGVGASLSGGARQRIGLARAFFRTPKILVLDEPNSNLDAEGEAALERALINARANGTTIFIVTHRPSIVLKCDLVMVLKNGAMESFGPVESLVQKRKQAATQIKAHASQADSRSDAALLKVEGETV